MTEVRDVVDDISDGPDRPSSGSTPEAGEPTTAGEETTAVAGRRRGLAVFAIGVVLALVATLAWALQERSRADDALAELDRSRQVSLAAASFVEALLTYDFADLDAQRAAVVDRATEQFEEEYLAAFTDDLASSIESNEATAAAAVESTFVREIEDDVAGAVVVVTSEVRTTTGASVVLESVLELTLRRVDGRWLVDEVTSRGSQRMGSDESGG